MTYRVIIEPRAERGIREAYRWISGRKSPSSALRWFNSLEKKILSLDRFPFRCPVAAENDKFPEEIRELLHGRRPHRYRILFTVREDAVHVLYVGHGARDEVEP